MSDEFEQDDTHGRRPRSDFSGRDRARKPARRAEDDELEPSRTGGSGNAKTIIIIISAVALVGFCGLASCIGLVVYGVARTRSAATAIHDQNNFIQIALAMHQYAEANGHFPLPAMKTRNGKPGLSWRVALLPYLEQQNLYLQFRLNEPWDSPANLRLAASMPPVFALVDDPVGDRTRIRLFVGKGAIFEPDRVLRLNEITDGTSQTIMFVEAAAPVLWIQPDELSFDPSKPLSELGSPNRDFFLAALADGEIRRVHKSIAPAMIKAAITATGNEPVNLDD